MRVRIDKQRCAGHARCNAIAPSLFVLDEHGYIATAGFDVPVEDEALVRRASKACPERIIAVIEEGGGAGSGGP